MKALNLHVYDNLNTGINHFDNSRIQIKFDGGCLKQEKVTFTRKQVLQGIIQKKSATGSWMVPF